METFLLTFHLIEQIFTRSYIRYTKVKFFFFLNFEFILKRGNPSRVVDLLKMNLPQMSCGTLSTVAADLYPLNEQLANTSYIQGFQLTPTDIETYRSLRQ